jgi:Domain of unknown function (DUF4936)
LSGVELYVYYRLAPADEAQACTQVLALQQRLCHLLPGLQARLLRRSGPTSSATADEAAGMSTWMETYRQDDGLHADQLALIRQTLLGVPHACVGARHEECFEPVGHIASGGVMASER